MRSERRIHVFVAILLPVVLTFAQLQTKSGDPLIHGIQTYDEHAILTAGSSGDSRYIPYLRLAGEESNSTDSLIWALAKLGERKEQQEIVCGLYSLDAGVMYETASEALPYIGGRFAVMAYERLFDQDARFAALRKGDEMFPGTPRFWALMELPKIFADPPLRPPTYSYGDWAAIGRDVASWKQWITTHEREIAKLKPAGTKIDYSGKSCPADKNIPPPGKGRSPF